MPRTKQTAKKATGGSAPRKERRQPSSTPALNGSLRRSRRGSALTTKKSQRLDVFPASESAKQVRPALDKDGNKWCYMCQDGGSLLFHCNSCPRIVCSRCITVPESVTSMPHSNDSLFMCPTCHMVRGRQNQRPGPYYGFYLRNESGWYGEPLLTSSIAVVGHFSLGDGAQIDSRSLCILHFVCKGQDVTGGPARMAKTYLDAYIEADNLAYVEVTFDLTADEDEVGFASYLTKLSKEWMEQKYARTLIFVTTHSDDISGDLFVGPNCTFEVGMWMDTFFGGAMAQVAKGSTLFLLTCGTVVNKPSTFAVLQKKVTEYGFASVWAFAAQRFQPNSLVPFVITFCQRVVIEGADALANISSLLAAAGQLNLHSDVLYLAPSPESILRAFVRRYVWSHKSRRPWGYELPAQCSACKCLKSWSEPVTREAAYVFTCESGVGDCKDRPQRLDFQSRHKSDYRFVAVGASSSGKWIEYAN